MKPRCLVGLRLVSIIMGLGALAGISRLASSEDYAGPLLPHVGLQVTTAFSNHFGADAESTLTFTDVTADVVNVNYTSTRGLAVPRSIRIIDRQNANTYVLGYAAGMPLLIPNTTSLGISGATLLELRTTGKAPLSLIYDAKMSRIDGQLTLVAKDIKMPLILENQLVEVPAIHATGIFGAGDKRGTADFYFLDNKNNPLMIEDTLQFSWEKQPRAERITRVTAGESMRSAMEQSLSTLRRYDLYGIHFDFDKATVRAESAALINEIALTLKNNATWTLQINGHTDSIGDAAYNQKLSAQRAASVAAAIVQQGIAADRLQTGGFGAAQPKGDNATLQGRALNRRVEMLRTDR